jgi:hypothetical protein
MPIAFGKSSSESGMNPLLVAKRFRMRHSTSNDMPNEIPDTHSDPVTESTDCVTGGRGWGCIRLIGFGGNGIEGRFLSTSSMSNRGWYSK